MTVRDLPAKRSVAARPAPMASRKRILDAAVELIARFGTTGMSMKLLADHVGLHKSTLFHHFSDKSELVEEVSMRFMAELIQRVERLESDDPPHLECLLDLAEDLDDYFAAHPWHALFMTRELIGPFDPTWDGDQGPEGRRFFGVFADWLVRAREAGVVRPMSVPHAIVNVIALALFFPALVDHFGDNLSIGATSEELRSRRKRELRETLLRALAP